MVDEKEPQAENFEEQLDSEKKRSEDYLTRLKYLQADFENIKKRFDREIDEIKCYSNERIIMELLDIVDELELAVKNGEISSQSTKSLVEGVEMTLKKLRKVLEQEGVSQIANPEGRCFNPSLHNAIAAVERDDIAENIVIEQIRSGYIMRGKVIRPTIVRVAIKPKNQSNEKQVKLEENIE
jgi:molecular chaperone GrpE